VVDVILDPSFMKKYSKVDKKVKARINKQLSKIKVNPDVGKPMRYSRKGTRELYVHPYRLSYLYGDVVYVLDLYHKDEQ